MHEYGMFMHEIFMPRMKLRKGKKQITNSKSQKEPLIGMVLSTHVKDMTSSRGVISGQPFYRHFEVSLFPLEIHRHVEFCDTP